MLTPQSASRRTWLQASTALLAALAWPGARAAGPASTPLVPNPALELPRISLAVGGKAAFYYLPLTVAEQLGFFRAQGLGVEIADYADADYALAAALSGQAEVVCGEYDQTLLLHSRKQYVQAFVQLGRNPQLVLGLSTRSLPGLRQVAELRGKKMGLPTPGLPASWLASQLSQRVLGRAGVLPSEVQFVYLDSTAAALQALRSGQIDALCHTDPAITQLEQKGDIKVVCDTRTSKATQDWFGGPIASACLFARLGFVQNHPATCQALASGIVHALKWLQTAGPSDLMKTVPEAYLLGDRAAYLAAFARLREAISADGVLPDEAAFNAWRAYSGLSSLRDVPVSGDKIVLSRTYTNAYALRAKALFKL